MFVPQFVPHREENPEPHGPAVMIIARSTQEPIMVKLPELYAAKELAAEDPPI